MMVVSGGQEFRVECSPLTFSYQKYVRIWGVGNAKRLNDALKDSTASSDFLMKNKSVVYGLEHL